MQNWSKLLENGLHLLPDGIKFVGEQVWEVLEPKTFPLNQDLPFPGKKSSRQVFRTISYPILPPKHFFLKTFGGMIEMRNNVQKKRWEIEARKNKWKMKKRSRRGIKTNIRKRRV